MGIFRQFQDYIARRRERNRQFAVIFFAGGCLSLLIFVVVGGAVALFFSQVERSAVNELYGEAIASSCERIPIGEDSMTNMPSTDAPYRVVLLQENTQRRHRWHNQLPLQWQATRGDEVDLIGCVQEITEVLETCSYLRDSVRGEEPYTLDIDREQSVTTILIVNPDTGRRVASQEVRGSVPDECPPDSDDVNISVRLEGDEPELEDFSAWLESLIFDE